jgi:hypothetical protein
MMSSAYALKKRLLNLKTSKPNNCFFACRAYNKHIIKDLYMASTASNTPPKDVMGFLEYYLVTKSPIQLPENAKAWIVKYGPWIEVVLLVLTLPLLLVALGISAVFLPFAGVAAPGAAAGIGLAWIVTLAQFGLMVAALPGLFARRKQGWTLAFYAQAVGLVVSLLQGNVIGALVWAVIGFFILFQIKNYYK